MLRGRSAATHAAWCRLQKGPIRLTQAPWWMVCAVCYARSPLTDSTLWRNIVQTRLSLTLPLTKSPKRRHRLLLAGATQSEQPIAGLVWMMCALTFQVCSTCCLLVCFFSRRVARCSQLRVLRVYGSDDVAGVEPGSRCDVECSTTNSSPSS